MEGPPAIAAPAGRLCGGLPPSAASPSPLCSRVFAASASSSSACDGRVSGVVCRGGGYGARRRSGSGGIKKETRRRAMAAGVWVRVYSGGRGFAAAVLRGRDGEVAEASGRRDDALGAFSAHGGRGGVTSSSASAADDEWEWDDGVARETARNERSDGAGRAPESAGLWRGRGGGGDARGRNSYSPKQPQQQPTASTIPSSELAKIEELKFAGDFQEGDSGPGVLNLQRALFWLGHLRGLSLTGYFGPETTRALREFQHGQGVAGTGVWDFRSRQMLWKHLRPQFDQYRAAPPVQKTSGLSQLKRLKIPDFRLPDSSQMIQNFSSKARSSGVHASEALRQWQARRRTEFVASISSLPRPPSDPGRLGVLVLSVVLVSSIAVQVHSRFTQPQGQPVRKRVMSWRTSGDFQRPPRKAPLRVQSGQQWRREDDEKEPLSSQNHQRPQPAEKPERFGGNLLDRLVLYEGQVIQGHYPTYGNSIARTRMDLGDGNRRRAEELPRHNHESLLPFEHQWGLTEGGAQKRNPAGVKLQTPEIYPPRKVLSRNRQFVRSEKSSRLTGDEQFQSNDGWPAWFRYLLFPFLLIRKALLGGPRKGLSRRTVVLSNGSRQSRSTDRERSSSDAGLPSSSSKSDAGNVIDNQPQRWQEGNELELTRRVEELHRTLQSVEETRVAAMRALAEEKMHNLELEVKIRRQKEATTSLEQEVQVLKDSHEDLLTTLKKKYSSSAAARAAAALIYQNWDPSDSSARI